ncbi:hypothetical protein C8Q78DRAFT_411525 [Trametes maxima]|nr:hypothetical protein C8Q78DRAFT_411525 [Trametes maxima]
MSTCAASGQLSGARLPFLVHSGTSLSSLNHTIDDDLGDSVTGLRPTYSPADGWIRNEAPSGVSLDTSRIVNGTWHQASGLGERSVSVTFTGVAVYVNLIIVRSMPPTLQETNLTFTLDPSAGPDADKTVDLQLPNLGTGGPLYSWEAYGVSRLPFRPHTLLISTVGATNSLFLFDSIRYVVEESDLPESAATRPSVTASSTQTSLSPSTGIPNTSVTSLQNGSDPTTTSTVSSHDQSTGPSASVGPIIGGVVGVVLAVAILIAVLLFRRRRTRRSSELREDIEPFNTGSENRNSPSVLPAPVRHVNPSETPFGETRALAPNKMVQRIAPGKLISYLYPSVSVRPFVLQ